MANHTDSTNPTPRLAGIIPIPVTPFTDNGALDLGSLRSQVEFCLDAGAHGLLYPGVVSEFFTLTDDERHQAVEACVNTVAGRLPVIIGVSGSSPAAAAAFAGHAAQLDAAGVMTMLPYVQHFFAPSLEYAIQHVATVADAAGLPVIFQNARIGHPVGVDALVSLVHKVAEVQYVKQETNPATQDLSAVIKALGDRIRGAFGGIGGVYLTNELDRGALGSMPSPAFVDRIVDAYAAYRRHGADACQARLDDLGTLFTRELLYNVALIKEVLRTRGVIRTAAVRVASPVLDAHDHADLHRLLTRAGLK